MQRSQCGNSVARYPRIRVILQKWSLLKWLHRPILQLHVPGHPGNGHWHDFILVRNMT